MRCIALNLRCITSHCTKCARRCIALRWVASICTALQRTALHCVGDDAKGDGDEDGYRHEDDGDDDYADDRDDGEPNKQKIDSALRTKHIDPHRPCKLRLLLSFRPRRFLVADLGDCAMLMTG